MQNLSDNKVTKKLFGSSGIRGDAEDFFTNQFCFDIGRVFSIFLNNHKAGGFVAVGMDPRESSPRIKEYLIKGLQYEGLEVFDQGVCPIPSINWLIKSNASFSGGIMISGSHIKAHLNGFKFFAFDEEILKVHEQEIEEIYQNQKEKVLLDNIQDFKFEDVQIEDDARTSYIEYLVSRSRFSNFKLKIVVDPGNGAASFVAPEFLELLGMEVVRQNCGVQRVFLSRDTEVSGDFDELQERVVKEKADLGIGYDSDGDRVVFVDENGSFIPGDSSGALIAQSIKGDVIVTPINTSSVVEKIGKKVIRTKVGSPYVLKAMKDNGACFGFEANGGGIFNEMHSRDGGRSSVEFLNILYESKKKVSELVASLPKTYILRDKVDYKWELKDTILAKAKEEFKGLKLDETDGLKIWLDNDSWILFRSSANAPEFRVFVESKSQSQADKLLKKGLEMVNNIVKT